MLLLLLLLRLSSQANRNKRRVEEGGPEGGCDILRDTSELVRHFRRPRTRAEPPNRGWTSVLSDNDANLAKPHPCIYRPRRLHHATDDNADSRAAEVGPNLRRLCAKGISQAFKDSISANGRHAPDHERSVIVTAAHNRFWTVCRIRILVTVSYMPKPTIDRKRN